jgi:hypothetical protein
MEEKIRMRPKTARVLEDPSSDSCYSPRSKLQSLTNIPLSHLPSLLKLELSTDIENLEFHKFGSLLPSLRELKLSNSSLDSIRDLGTDWKNLQVLWLVKTGLSSIDGISAFPVLKELYCAFNQVSSLSALFLNETIQCLDMEGNQVQSMEEIDSLQYCSSLFSLTLEGNPVSKLKNYRTSVFSLLKSLVLLDDTEKQSEVLTETSEEVEMVLNSVRESSRILKKSLIDSRSKTEKNIFSDVSSHLTEEVFSGNPIKAMRYRRKKLLEGNNIMNLVREFKVNNPQEEKKKSGKDFRLKPRAKDSLFDTQ